MDNAEVADLQKELEEYLQRDAHGEVTGCLHLVHKGNHLIWKGQYRDGWYFALRMADPAHYRAGEWLSAYHEYELLQALERTRLAPQPYRFFEGFKQPFLTME